MINRISLTTDARLTTDLRLSTDGLNWREAHDPDEDDDTLLQQTPAGVVAMLGFDPLDFSGAEDAQPEPEDDDNEDGDEDEPSAQTPAGLIAALGFDPLDVMAEDAIEDAVGHHHSEADGKFVSKGGGGGAKGEEAHAEAKAAASKSVREGLRKLFKTGHSFSVKELSEILGVPEAQTKVALNFIKNPKKATAKFSTLELVQDTKTGEYSLKKMTEASIAAQKAPIESIPDPTAVPVVAKSVGGSISEEKANQLYASAMHNAAIDLQQAVGFGGNFHDAMLQWKKKRALLMAQWKADTTGKDVTAFPQQLYQADQNFWNNLKTEAPMMLWGDAFAQWKKDTQLEKLGQLNKPKTPEPEYESTAPVYEHADAAKYDGLNKIPAGFKQIGKTLFKGPDATSTEYYKGFTETHKAFESGSSEHGSGGAVENKIVVQKDIEARLKGSEAFQKLEKLYSKATSDNPNASLVRRLVGSWASSSGDHNPVSSYMQHMVADVFRMKDNELALDHISNRPSAFKGLANSLGIGSALSVDDINAGLKDFIRAQYDNTQAFLKKQGLKEVYVARGMKFGSSKGKAEEINLKLQPASSFSHSHYTASSFAGGGTVFMVKVPASQVLGSYRTGYGCTNEQEVTLLAAPNMKAIAIGKDYAPTAETAVHRVREQLGLK